MPNNTAVFSSENIQEPLFLLAETQKFYKALSQVGTDFGLMLPLFPNRIRKELKVCSIVPLVQMLYFEWG